MPMPPPTGNALIDGVMPLFRLMDDAAEAEPVLMWLAWAMVATTLAALPAVASRLRSMILSPLLILPGALLLVVAFTLFSTLLGDLVSLHPFLNVAAALAVSAAVVLAGWRYAGTTPRHLQSAEVTLRLARPVLVVSMLLVSLMLLPFTTPAAIPPLLGAAVFITEALLAPMTIAALTRASTSRSSADLVRFGCVAPVFVVPDGGMSYDAVAVGLTHESSAVFLQQHVEVALRSDDPAAVRRATHILAHEAGHVVQQHGLWRAVGTSGVAIVLPLVVRANGFASLLVTAAILIVLGVGALALGEWAAERFARRATTGPDSPQAAMGAVR